MQTKPVDKRATPANDSVRYMACLAFYSETAHGLPTDAFLRSEYAGWCTVRQCATLNFNVIDDLETVDEDIQTRNEGVGAYTVHAVRVTTIAAGCAGIADRHQCRTVCLKPFAGRCNCVECTARAHIESDQDMIWGTQDLEGATPGAADLRCLACAMGNRCQGKEN
ncbi:hypothetical protein GF108_20900 [Phyllobacterium sp. SYP-B3895]|nr:hypothetical protein [Phyllobacterium sp. SYP-B3895]